ncbi:MAG: vitamin K epoxide reductase family protein [Prochloraceae cyanobacterium]
MRNIRRRRSVPWIYRYSRYIIGAIAIFGAILTAYLTFEKLTGGEVGCSIDGAAGGCNNVLNSPYATVFGLPLSLFGTLAYTGMATFSLAPLAVNPDSNRKLRSQLENWTWLLLLAGGVAMAVFSSYLMYVLFTEIQAICPYCIASALFSLSFLVLTIIGREWDDLGQIFFTGAIVALITLVGTLGIYSGINSNLNAEAAIDPATGRIIIPEAEGQARPPKGWEINTTSGAAEIELAKHLTAIGAKKYGAFWCPHCYEQKQLFGKEAFQDVNYIECARGGVNPQRQACLDAGIQSFPTWEINGKLYSGVQSLDRLADLSDYRGSRNFKYTMGGF